MPSWYALQVVSEIEHRLWWKPISLVSSSRKNVFPISVFRSASIDPEAMGVAADELTLGAELLVEVAMAVAADAAAPAAQLDAVDFDALEERTHGFDMPSRLSSWKGGGGGGPCFCEDVF